MATSNDSKRLLWWTAVSTLVSLAALIVSLHLIENIWNHFEGPKATIVLPSEAAVVSQSFGASGTISHIPADKDIWLVVRAGIQGDWYPAARLNQSGGNWSIEKDLICPANGAQGLQLWVVPDSQEAGLLEFRQKSASGQNPAGLSSMPPSAVLQANVDVTVKGSLGACA